MSSSCVVSPSWLHLRARKVATAMPEDARGSTRRSRAADHARRSSAMRGAMASGAPSAARRSDRAYRTDRAHQRRDGGARHWTFLGATGCPMVVRARRPPGAVPASAAACTASTRPAGRGGVLAPDVAGGLVLAEALKRRMTDLAVARPLGECHLRDERGLHPVGVPAERALGARRG